MALLDIEQKENSDLLAVGADGLNDIQEIECPAPGIYYDMPAERYHKIRAASASQLKILRRSPAHLLASELFPQPPTPAMLIGTAVHARVLEPLEFERHFAVSPKFDRRTTKGKEAAAEFEIENLGKSIIDTETFALCESIYDSLMGNPILRRLLESPGHTEVSLFWEDPDTHVQCKGRADKILEIEGENITLDLKTAINASAEDFARQAFNLGYHIQAPFYLDAATRCFEVEHADFLFVPVEKEPPFAFGIYRMDDQAVDLGRTEYKRLLALWKECEDTHAWPGYSNEIQSLSLPAWAYR